MTENKDAYVEKLQAKMDEWNAEIDKLEAKIRQASADSKIKHEKDLENLRAKRRELEEKLTQVQQSGKGAWQDLKAGIEIAGQALDMAVKSAASRFRQGKENQ